MWIKLTTPGVKEKQTYDRPVLFNTDNICVIEQPAGKNVQIVFVNNAFAEVVETLDEVAEMLGEE